MDDQPKIRVFYNSACPVCDAGIKSQKGKASNCGVDWEDVHLDNNRVQELNADLEFVRERLHVIDTEGNLKIGYEAFITIWSHSPNEQWKANISKVWGIRWVLNIGYNLFAKALYKWNRSKQHW